MNTIAKLNKIALGMLKDKDKAEDIVQDVLLSFLEVYPELDWQSEDSMALLSKMVRNAVIDMTRKKKEVCFSDMEMEDEDGESVTYEPAGTYGDVNYDDVETLIHSLRPKLREAADLVFLKGLSYAEASESLGISESALTSRLHEARKLIQKELED